MAKNKVEREEKKLDDAKTKGIKVFNRGQLAEAFAYADEMRWIEISKERLAECFKRTLDCRWENIQ